MLITLVTLIYLYMTGKLEPADVANMDQPDEAASIVTTVITTDTVETEPVPEEETEASEETEEPEEEPSETEEEESPAVIEEDIYDEAFFANDYFIGDSIYTGLVNYGYFPESQVFAQVGLNPDSALTKEYGGYTAVSRAEEMQPKRIFIMLGSNGLAYLGNTHMADQMKVLVTQLREVCPDSYIYIVSI